MRKLGTNGGLYVSCDDLTIALSRLNALLSLEDAREFFCVVAG